MVESVEVSVGSLLLVRSTWERFVPFMAMFNADILVCTILTQLPAAILISSRASNVTP